MKSLSTVWSYPQQDMEANIPLLWQARRRKKVHPNSQCWLIFLSPTSTLPVRYLATLKHYYKIIDASKIYQDLAIQFSSLDQFGEYEKKCFLRWLVIKKVLAGEEFIHYDGDVILNVSLEKIFNDFRHQTFLLEGGPAFAVIHDHDWIRQYQKQLERFSKNIVDYSQQAWQQRKGWQTSRRQKWAGQRFRKIISSDQDLFSHLIHTDQIKQSLAKKVLRQTDLFLMENPLYPQNSASAALPLKYQRRNGVDYLNDHTVAFWHLQTDFVVYLNRFLRRGWLNKISRVSNQQNHFHLETKLLNFSNSIFGKRYLSRLEICKYFFDQTDFSQVYNEKTFWETGVFPDI